MTFRAPIVVGEDEQAVTAGRAELAGAGWGADLVEVRVRQATDVQPAVLTALRGAPVLVDAAGAPAEVIGDLVEDLERVTPVLLRRGADAPVLDSVAWQLLHALAGGATLAGAARAVHVSLRTANRRVTDACAALGTPSRAQAVRAAVARDRVPPRWED